MIINAGTSMMAASTTQVEPRELPSLLAYLETAHPIEKAVSDLLLERLFESVYLQKTVSDKFREVTLSCATFAVNATACAAAWTGNIANEDCDLCILFNAIRLVCMDA